MNKLNFSVIWKISIFTNATNKFWSLVMNGLADVDGFKISIQVCVWPRFLPLILLNGVKFNHAVSFFQYQKIAIQMLKIPSQYISNIWNSFTKSCQTINNYLWIEIFSRVCILYKLSFFLDTHEIVWTSKVPRKIMISSNLLLLGNWNSWI